MISLNVNPLDPCLMGDDALHTAIGDARHDLEAATEVMRDAERRLRQLLDEARAREQAAGWYPCEDCGREFDGLVSLAHHYLWKCQKGRAK